MRLRRALPSRRAALAFPFAAIAVLGAGLAFAATPSSASSTCSFYAAPNGSDANSGTSASPFATVEHLASALAPGQTGCLAAGATFVSNVSLSHGGQPGAPIVLTSADPANPATIKGRIVTFPGGDWITFTQLKLDGVNAGALPSPTVGSDHVTFSNVDVTNEHTAICFDLINSTSWGVAHYTTIDSSRIHGCGELPSTNQDHGIYVSGYYATITNNYIYDNADRGVQLRGSQNGTIQHNVIDRNGEGVIFGDEVTSNNDVSNNIVSNSNIRWNAESYWGSGPVGTGNSFHNNCVWASNSESYYDSQGGVDGGDGFSASANTVGNPLYVNAAAGNYAIPSGSPCAGKGPLTTSIGVSTSPPPAPHDDRERPARRRRRRPAQRLRAPPRRRPLPRPRRRRRRPPPPSRAAPPRAHRRASPRCRLFAGRPWSARGSRRLRGPGRRQARLRTRGFGASLRALPASRSETPRAAPTGSRPTIEGRGFASP